MEQAAEAKPKVRGVGRPNTKPVFADAVPPASEQNAGNEPGDSTEAMNALALRIWEGQSIDLPVNERTRRVVAGLNAQGYTDTSNLALPKA